MHNEQFLFKNLLFYTLMTLWLIMTYNQRGLNHC